ncbi:MAG: FAD-dependent oxidoreductase [Acidobacteria bacterium]|nr:FAD-dependent oxidoreductase [Acidobacteriota bacterium]
MDTRTDILIVGGGTGGCAAALAALRNGLRVIVTEECDWIGGQFTSQGVPPDEHGWIEEFGCTRSYREFRNAIRRHYLENAPLTTAARAMRHLNPGNGWVSPLCHEPFVSHSVIRRMLAQYEVSGHLEIRTNARAVSADVEQDRIASVVVEREGRTGLVEARFFLDATELGDLLPLAGAEFETGSPGRPANAQAFSWCFAMEHFPGEDHRISRPARYEYWRDYTPRLTPPWPGRLLDWTTPHPRTMEPNHYRFSPGNESPKAFSGLWSYRRLIDASLFSPGTYASDVCLVNWPLIDYLEGDLLTASPAERARYLAEAREMSLAVFCWLQNDAPRADGGCGWPGLRLAGGALGTSDGFAKQPYIRESRRMAARKTITEEDVSAEHRPGARLGEEYRDSVGIGYYRIDLHPSTGGDNYVDVPALPFRIPLGALIPVRLGNLLPAAKNLGVTHVTNGCYRLHPVEWNIGEASALAAVWCLRGGIELHHLPDRSDEFQQFLMAEGIELAWPANLDLENGDAHRHAR